MGAEGGRSTFALAAVGEGVVKERVQQRRFAAGRLADNQDVETEASQGLPVDNLVRQRVKPNAGRRPQHAPRSSLGRITGMVGRGCDESMRESFDDQKKKESFVRGRWRVRL